ncbi:MAG: hypothetical protein HQM15_08305 [Deltaproteobacteria bacterium]|nr:hypothetical protein [Deltaproteobacteria bacterium]
MSPKIKICKENKCSNAQTTEGFCRFHYLKNWSKIQAEKKKKSAKALERYVDSILKRNPDAKTVQKRSVDADPLDFEGTTTPFFSRDDFDDVMEDLGYKEDLDRLLDNIKVDKDF